MSHTFLVAFEVEGEVTRPEAEEVLTAELVRVPKGPGPFQVTTYVDSWWIAEDDRHDRSDTDSAVFVTKGAQADASRVLEREALSPAWNLTPPPAAIIRQAALYFLHSEDPPGFDLGELADALGVDRGDVEALG